MDLSKIKMSIVCVATRKNEKWGALRLEVLREQQKKKTLKDKTIRSVLARKTIPDDEIYFVQAKAAIVAAIRRHILQNQKLSGFYTVHEPVNTYLFHAEEVLPKV